MAAITSKPSPAPKTPATHQRGLQRRRLPAVRLSSAVDRTTELSDEVLVSLGTSHRAAIEAVGRFVVTVEEAVPQEVACTSEVAKKITESGLETIDRLVQTAYDLLRSVIDSAGKSLSSSNGAAARPAH